MDDNSLLLRQRRISRSPQEPRKPLRRTLIAAAVLLAGLNTAVASTNTTVLEASGYVVARRLATVGSKTIGRVAEVSIEEGQQVEKDQIVARLDDSNARAAAAHARAEVAQAVARLEAARIALEDARPIFRRNEQQRQAGVISAQELDNARAAINKVQTAFDVSGRDLEFARAGLTVALRDLNETVLRAPFTGVVTVKAAQPGEIVSPQSAGDGLTRTGICTVVDMTSLEVQVDISENFINRLYAGQPATVRLNAYPDWAIPAELIAVIPTADRSKATVAVRVGFKERDPRILPQMSVRVAFLGGSAPPAGKAARPEPARAASEAVLADGDHAKQ